MTEQQLQDYITAMCDRRRLWWMHIRDSRQVEATDRGWPDLVIIGRCALFAELKAEDGRRSMDQVYMGNRMIAAGLDYVLWRPAHLHNGSIATALDELAR